MLVKIPTIISNDDRQYKLFLEYRCTTNLMWEWVATYLDDHGILFRSNSYKRLQDVEDEVFSFIDKHRFETT